MERRTIEIAGIVQGVGFRPFVYHLAREHGLSGFVRNESGSVRIEVEGKTESLDAFILELTTRPPALASIEALTWKQQLPRGDGRFRIEESEGTASGAIFISPDVATCRDCLRELFDPADRRYRYPFLNCTNCGPRLSIVTGAPYDRSRTTLAAFPLCRDCQAEYNDPGNRRFHAQPIACPVCGPSLALLGSSGEVIAAAERVAFFALALREGKIGAIKGLGGFHLACDASNATVVGELRRRKQRDEKPFAIMAANVEAARSLCEINEEEEQLLTSVEAPIVLLRKRPATGLAENIAPGNPALGVMLPYAPIHHLLVQALEGMPIVMTSGNLSDEPIVYRDDGAEKLLGIADLMLTHNRPIHVRCDDSVTRVLAGTPYPLRRARGYAPRPINLPFECPRPLLAVGGQLKCTFALAHGRQAFLSQHLGDLDHFDAFRAFVADVQLFEQLFHIRPQCLAHDLHPDYQSTRYALDRANRTGIPMRGVQHHHAHVASCMVENGLTERVIGVSFDGTGYGTDGTIWGGEFLIADYRRMQRAGHLRVVPMPGGERAIRQPWRMALAHLLDAECRLPPGFAPSPIEERVVRRMLDSAFQTPLTSSMGRLFDAVAALIGVRSLVSYEGQAAIELEWLATDVQPQGRYPFEISARQTEETAEFVRIVDTRPTIQAIVADLERKTPREIIARRFHSTVVEMIAGMCREIRGQWGINRVLLSGGVFLNLLLAQETSTRLGEEEFQVHRHKIVPANDGGLSLGQAAIAAALDKVEQEG